MVKNRKYIFILGTLVLGEMSPKHFMSLSECGAYENLYFLK
jgi:hypothetical protein